MLAWIKAHSKYVTYFLLGAALIVLYKTFDNLSGLFSGVKYVFSAFAPFVFAFVVAYLLNIPAKRIKSFIDEKVKNRHLKKHSGAVSIALVYVIFIALIVVIISSIIPAITKDLVDIISNMDVYAQNVVDFVNNLGIAKNNGFALRELDFEKSMSSILDKFLSIEALSYTKTITTGIASFASGFMNIFIGLIASVYMLIDKDRILRAISRYAKVFGKDGRAEAFIGYWSRVNEIFTQYIYSRLICCVVMAVACTLLLVIMGEKYAVLLGIFIGFMDLIPYFGSIISWFVGLAVMAISGGWPHAIWTSAIILVMQQLDGNVLAPRVMSSRLEIRPLAIIVAVSVGGTLFGFVGMILSVPVVTIIKAAVNEFIEEKTISEKEKDTGNDK